MGARYKLFPACNVVLLLSIVVNPAAVIVTAQRSAAARLLYLDSDCDACVTVDADAGEYTLLEAGDCRSARTRDKYWLFDATTAGGGGPGHWCLDDAPNLCVEEGGALLLSERSSSRWQQWELSTRGTRESGAMRLEGTSGECVTLQSGGTLRMTACGFGRPNQEWQIGEDYCEPDNAAAEEGTLIYLNRECNECLGVDRAADDEGLVMVECDDDASLRHWAVEYVSSSIVDRWCLAGTNANRPLCIAEVGNTLRLRDDSADSFIFNGRTDEIESFDNANQCVTRVGSNVELQPCWSNADQQWTKQEQTDWEDVCIADGVVIYNESQCGVCIVADSDGVGAALVEGDCDMVPDERKLFTFQNEGHWCLESNDRLCVERESDDRLTLRTKSTNGSQEWVYDSGSNEVQTLLTPDLCVARQSSGGVEVQSCNSRTYDPASSWIMADYDRQYRNDCIRQTGNDPTGGNPTGTNPCEEGDLFVLDYDCNWCVGVRSGQVAPVDCVAAADADKLWDFTDNGLWRLRADPNLCVNSDLQLQTCVAGKQSLFWTYSDESQIGSVGEKKIAQWSAPDRCLARRGFIGSTSLALVSCRSGDSMALNLDFNRATDTCKYNCFNVMSFGDSERIDEKNGGEGVQHHLFLSLTLTLFAAFAAALG